jgi:hypothetical protein
MAQFERVEFVRFAVYRSETLVFHSAVVYSVDHVGTTHTRQRKQVTCQSSGTIDL